MKNIYKKARKEYSDSNGPSGCYANKIMTKLENTGAYPLTVAEELSHIGAFRKSLPKDNGAQSPSDESFDEMINSGEYGFFDIDEFHWVEILSNYKSNYKSKVVKESYRPSSK